MGSPWENGDCAAFNGTLREDRLDREIFSPLAEARIFVDGGRPHDHTVRPHSALGYRPLAPEARSLRVPRHRERQDHSIVNTKITPS
jgi:putative transposase